MHGMHARPLALPVPQCQRKGHPGVQAIQVCNAQAQTASCTPYDNTSVKAAIRLSKVDAADVNVSGVRGAMGSGTKVLTCKAWGQASGVMPHMQMHVLDLSWLGDDGRQG
jgi:hypothetical protein